MGPNGQHNPFELISSNKEIVKKYPYTNSRVTPQNVQKDVGITSDENGKLAMNI